MPPHHPARFCNFPQPVPAPQPVNLIPADFYIQVPHRDEMRQRGYLVLGCENDARRPNGVRKAEFFDLRKAFAKPKLSISINARMRDRFVERYLRRPLRDGIVTLAAFIQPNMYRLGFARSFRGSHHKPNSQPWCRSGIAPPSAG